MACYSCQLTKFSFPTLFSVHWPTNMRLTRMLSLLITLKLT
ncbi:hypothetical protein Goari_012422 [Gossypium aridum]|uniref:Uncharacterized protein n=1 Tax=Gossypium aridum TaxID=34290 RepID=A0A7J8X0C3_GOSAI|nr:hypothetical protein [Gossypium aridum]